MRVDRRKHIRKILQWYRIAFGFEAPYTVLVDGPFILAALNGKVFLKEQLPKLCEERAYPVVTRCIQQDIRKRGDDFGGAAIIAKNLTAIKCSHARCVSGAECIASLIEDRAGDKYLVGSMEEDLQKRVRRAGGVPLIRISNNTLVLEKPSNESRELHAKAERAKAGPAKHEKAAWERMQKPKPEEGAEAAPEAAAAAPAKPKPGKRKRPKEPNPLSCKKKVKVVEPKVQATPAAAPESASEGEKPKRKRKRRRKAKGPAAAAAGGAGAEEGDGEDGAAQDGRMEGEAEDGGADSS